MSPSCGASSSERRSTRRRSTLVARRGVALREDVRAPLRGLTAAERARLDAWLDRRRRRRRGRRLGRLPPRVARGPRRRALRPREVASGATAKAMGGVRQQFSTAAEVRLAQASVRFFEASGAPFFDQVGYVFVATSDAGWAELEQRAALQRSLGVPVETTVVPPGVRGDDVRGAVACWSDGVADPAAVARELVRRAVELGVELREETDAAAVEGDVLVVACGPCRLGSRPAAASSCPCVRSAVSSWRRDR